MTEKLFQITRQVNLIVDEYDGEILTNDEARSTLQTYTGEETLTHDDDSEKQTVDEETLTHVKFNSEYEDAKSVTERSENEEENDESQDKDEAITDGSM